MKRVLWMLGYLSLAPVLFACGPHTYMQALPRYDIEPATGITARAPHDRKVFVTEQTLDPGSYEVLGTIDVTKVWYGSRSSVLSAMGDMGRKMGADAVIDAKVWFRPVGWAWASPQGSGKAVALRNPSNDFTKILGEYW